MDLNTAYTHRSAVPSTVSRRVERCSPQDREIVRHVFNRTLEVWGSIPHVSTRKTKHRVEIRGVFVFGRTRRPFRNSRP